MNRFVSYVDWPADAPRFVSSASAFSTSDGAVTTGDSSSSSASSDPLVMRRFVSYTDWAPDQQQFVSYGSFSAAVSAAPAAEFSDDAPVLRTRLSSSRSDLAVAIASTDVNVWNSWNSIDLNGPTALKRPPAVHTGNSFVSRQDDDEVDLKLATRFDDDESCCCMPWRLFGHRAPRHFDDGAQLLTSEKWLPTSLRSAPASLRVLSQAQRI